MPGSQVAVLTHESGLAHDTGSGHPERPARLRAVISALEAFSAGLVWVDPPEADRTVLELAHDPGYLDLLDELHAGGGGWVDQDTVLGPRSLEAARRSAGAAVEGVRLVAGGEVSGAMVCMRPPGHHAPYAGPGRWPPWARSRPSMGFCLVNHAAVAARWAVRSGAAKRVAVVDFDAHHGNGTQDVFWSDPDVLYASLHQWPFYPGTGDVDEVGAGAAAGTTVNVPLPAGTAEDAYSRAVEDVVLPALRTFRPDVLVVSAGYDAHLRDPVCMMRLTTGAFFRMTRLLAGVAPGVYVLEGGYDLDALSWGAAATVAALLGEGAPPGVPESDLQPVTGSTDAHSWVERAALRRGATRGPG